MSERERDDDHETDFEPTARLDKHGKRTQQALERIDDHEPGFMDKLDTIAERLGTKVEWLINVMMAESGLRASAKNPKSTATGLIQFMAKTARALGTSVHALRKMSAVKQLDWVERYFKPFKGKLTSQAAVYAAVGAGHVGEQGDRTVFFRRGSKEYRANRVWDVNKDGRITQGEMGRVASRFGAGTQFEVETDDDRESPQREPADRDQPQGEGDREEQVQPGRLIRHSVGDGGTNALRDTEAVQQALASHGFDPGKIDRECGPNTIRAIRRFQRTFMKNPDGLVEVGKITEQHLMDSTTRPPRPRTSDEPRDEDDERREPQREREQPRGGGRTEADRDEDSDTSPKGQQQMSRLESVADNVAGLRPHGKCYRAVKHHIANAGGYGNIRNIYTDPRFSAYQGEAHMFADRVNQNPAAFGLEKLSISNPYEAPVGSIVVVAAGSPGTHDPRAGDITVKGPGDAFYNDGNMKYGSRQAWPPRRGGVLGVYKPK
ncbi:MAG TPA: peptidoglycan-binding protein [Kofleriaceae bacterium]|nr:peptidoglycan-binding protein [Kofleriaceae bacterium]